MEAVRHELRGTNWYVQSIAMVRMGGDGTWLVNTHTEQVPVQKCRTGTRIVQLSV